VDEKGRALEESMRRNPSIAGILDMAPTLNLPNWYLGAGCVAQTVWNELHGFAPTAHIKDYDFVYFDDSDLSYESENSHIKEGEKLFQSLGVKVEMKNEARVHLWYQEHFGYSISPYKSVEDAIASWPTTATSIGVKLDERRRFMAFAPFGLDDLYGLVVRPNKRQITKEIYLEKVQRWTKFWPNLKVVPWD
jgi:hypothetical protein